MQFLENVSKVKILVVGDLMLDRYWWGSVTRISPEAPVPVVNLKQSTHSLGGAANVAANIKGLTAEPLLCGIIGKDDEAKKFCELLEDLDISTENLIQSELRPTTVKTRVIAHSQHVLRIDQEVNSSLTEIEEKQIIEKLESIISNADLVIASDYAKGLLTENVLVFLVNYCTNKNIKLFVDPKGKNYQKYTGATLITPNKKETSEACNIEENSENLLEVAGNKLLQDIRLESLLITLGEDGMALFQKEKPLLKLKASAREIYDVTGAGDTVIATLATAVAAGESLESAAKIANTAAGIVVEQVGTTTIKLTELASKIELN